MATSRRERVQRNGFSPARAKRILAALKDLDGRLVRLGESIAEAAACTDLRHELTRDLSPPFGDGHGSPQRFARRAIHQGSNFYGPAQGDYLLTVLDG